MRIGLDLRDRPPADVVAVAAEADRLGLWAVLVGGPTGTEALVAAEIATATEHVHVAVQLDADDAHPSALAEELVVLDHLSRRRALGVIKGPVARVEQVRRLLAGEIVDGFAVAPPPAQTTLSVWHADAIAHETLRGDLADDRMVVDRHRDGGTTHLFVDWPGDVFMLARHLVTRALAPDFPDIVATHADVIAPRKRG